MVSKQKTVYLDCTATLFSGLNTGIQRVVRNVIRRQTLMEQEFQIKVKPVVGVMGTFYEVSAEVVLDAKPITASIGIKIRTAFDKMKRVIIKKFPWPRPLLPSVEFSLAMIEWSLKKIFWAIKFARMIKTVHGEGSKKAVLGPEDRIVLLDAFWQFDLSKSLKNTNPPKVVTIMFDLVPVNHPDCVEEVNRNLFMKALPWALRATDRFICISKDVRDQLFNYCEKNEIKGKEFDYFLLGSDFAPPKIEQKPTEEWEKIFASGDVWVMVGTIEPRKNHIFALDAFDLSWKAGDQAHLLIIGRIGWKCDELVDRILKHPEYNKKLFFKWDVSDVELQYAYQNSEGLVFSSFAEGFGLPLVEAMASQIKVICSDIPIFREVGGDYPIYFSLDDPKNLVVALEQAKKAPKPLPVKWLSWDESVRSFISKVLKD